ncbi:MAG: hypothetical protein ACLQVM_14945 [Terriglobia bacterium]
MSEGLFSAYDEAEDLAHSPEVSSLKGCTDFPELRAGNIDAARRFRVRPAVAGCRFCALSSLKLPPEASFQRRKVAASYRTPKEGVWPKSTSKWWITARRGGSWRARNLIKPFIFSEVKAVGVWK